VTTVAILATRALSHLRQPAWIASPRGVERLQLVVAGPVEIGAALEEGFGERLMAPLEAIG
jgi:hypothetical protein